MSTRSGIIALAALALALSLSPPADAAAGNTKTPCVYTAHSITILQQFDALVGRDMDCVMVYNNASTDWDGWERPWFIRNVADDNNWRAWATVPGTQRRLIITQGLFPASEQGTDWRTAGARGDYVEHAKALAQNLVAAGLGNSVIRLSHEANGDWNPDSIGTTATDFANWRQFWRNTVLAMKSVPGANFSFDWCINARYRAIPLSDFYPGDDVVDIVGIDAYDGAVPLGQPRWATLYNKPDGIGDVVAFARAHGKLLSIPEWGLIPSYVSGGGGDDPGYVDGIASVVRDNVVAYQAYFYKYDFATQLASGPLSLASYRLHFGAGGDSVGGTSVAQPAPAPGGSVANPPAQSAPTKSKTSHRSTHRAHRAAKRRHRHRRRHVRKRRR